MANKNIDELSVLTEEGKESIKRMLDIKDDGGDGGESGDDEIKILMPYFSINPSTGNVRCSNVTFDELNSAYNSSNGVIIIPVMDLFGQHQLTVGSLVGSDSEYGQTKYIFNFYRFTNSNDNHITFYIILFSSSECTINTKTISFDS